jgi:hypothetical protein
MPGENMTSLEELRLSGNDIDDLVELAEAALTVAHESDMPVADVIIVLEDGTWVAASD